jgi:hypothetical protein
MAFSLENLTTNKKATEKIINWKQPKTSAHG